MKKSKKIIIGSRGSDLALWQANHVREKLEKIGFVVEIKIIKTQGDKVQDLSFDKLEGKGFFTKELEEALLKGEIDVAVHSFKDLPTEQSPKLIIAAVSDRHDPSDILLINKNAVDFSQKFSLKQKAITGTSSTRRKMQLFSFRKDLVLKDVRGNVPTRIEKLRRGDYDAIMLAAAGVERLEINLNEFHVEKLDTHEFVPAPAQGALAIQILKTNTGLFIKIQKHLDNSVVATEINIERRILQLFEGGCSMPIGIHCKKENGKYKAWLAVSEKVDEFPVRIFAEVESSISLPEIVFRKAKNIQPTSVFITRDIKKEDYFYRALTAKGYTVSGNSLIESKPVKFDFVPQTDWIFFSSRNGVKHFFEQIKKHPKGVKYGVIGKGTEDELRKYKIKADFIGTNSDIEIEGKAFATIAANQSVLFPQAKDSLQTIQKQFSIKTNLFNLIVYETVEKNNVEFTPTDIVVLTSPSNAEVFLMKNKYSYKNLIVMGKSTAAKVNKISSSKYIVSNMPNELGLVETVFSLSNS